MKLFITVMCLLTLLIVSCQPEDQITEYTDSESALLNKKPGTTSPNPSYTEPLLTFSMGGILLFQDNTADNIDHLFTLSNDQPLEVSYSIISPDVSIDTVIIDMYYDSNTDNVIHFNRELGVNLLSMNPKGVYEYTMNWDGTVRAAAYNDPTYGLNDNPTDPLPEFILTDQLATTSPNEASSKADRYRINIWFGDKTGIYGNYLSTYIWLENSIQPEFTFHVENICFSGVYKDGRINRGDFKVKVVADQLNKDLTGATIWFYFNDNVNGSYGRASVLNVDNTGWSTIPVYFRRKSDFGTYKFTVAAVQYFNGANKVMAVYNPLENDENLWGSWPANLPSLTVNITPDTEPVCSIDLP